jgi:hypothetical protein
MSARLPTLGNEWRSALGLKIYTEAAVSWQTLRSAI